LFDSSLLYQTTVQTKLLCIRESEGHLSVVYNNF